MGLKPVRRGPSRLAWTLLVAAVLLLVGSFLISVISGTGGIESDSPLDSTLFGLSLLVFAAVGALIASRRPENAVGWIFLIWGLVWSIQSFGISYGSLSFSEPGGLLPGAAVAAWIANWTITPAIYGFVFLALVFPDGRVLTRRWRIVGWLGALGAISLTVGAAFAPGHLVDQFKDIQNPFGWPAAKSFFEALQGIGWALWMPTNAAAAASLIVRYLRSNREQRQQLKWFAVAGAFLAFAFLLSAVSYGTYAEQLKRASEILILFALPAVPVAAGIAVLKYRLYDIDIVINKTIVFGALAAFITAVYVGVVVGIGSIVGQGDRPNLALSLAATAIVAVAFQPVRERVQRLANKLVYGERVTPYEAVTSFSHRMAESLSLDEVLPQMAEAAARGVGGVRSRVRLFLPGGGEQAVNWPSESKGNSFDRVMKVIHQEEEVGEISVAKAPGEQITKSEENLLQDLASQAGLAMRNLRLTGELQQRLVELRESRSRIVKAQDEERRRMEHEITDGPQQQLGKIAAKLGLAHSLARTDSNSAARVLDEVKVESDAAIESVRDLARGLFPKILADRGLSAAIEAHISKTGIRAIVQDETNGARFSPDVEANFYFCIREALHMAPKRPAVAPIAVSLAIVDFTLEFSVRDGGHSERATLPPSVQNIQDRLEALGGSFDIQSAPEGGTELLGLIPIKAMEPAS